MTRRMTNLTATTIAAFLCAAGPAAAQSAPSAEPVFRSTTSLVALNVIVTDQQKRFSSGLSAGDFQVFEDGVLQDLEFFAAAEVPLDLILLLDASSSMNDKLKLVHEAAAGFINSMRPDDRGAVVGFSDHVRVLQPLTSDRDAVRAAIQQTGAKGATSLYNAVYVALKEFGRAAAQSGDVRRQAIVVLSDGEDTASLMSFDDVLNLAKRSGVSIYTIGLRSEYDVRKAQKAGHRYFSEADYSMKTIAQETGAQAFFPDSINDLADVYAAIADELASQYAIGYVPQNTRTDGRYRRVVVRVVDRPELKTRTRTGYYLAGETGAASGGSR